MARGLTVAAQTAASAERVVRTVAVEMDFPSGFVRLNGSPTSIFINGNEFLGIGGLGAITPIEESGELRSFDLSVSLSGVPRDSVALALTQAYQGRRGTAWEVLLNPDTNLPIADPVLFFRGRMDQLDITMGQTATVSVKMLNRLGDWERPRLRRYTDQEQQRRHPRRPGASLRRGDDRAGDQLARQGLAAGQSGGLQMRPRPARQRVPDWPEQLAALLEQRREAPFYYGSNDCAGFGADVALALVGEDPAAWIRGSYDDEAALERILAERGGFEAAVAQTMADFGAPECPPAFAMRGDWALVDTGNQLLVGIVLGDTVAVTGLDGLRFAPISWAKRTWAI